MVQISGMLVDVTGRPSTVREVWVRSERTRPVGGRVVTDEPVRVEVTGGRVAFECEPGSAQLVLVHQSDVPTPGQAHMESVPLIVAEGMDLGAAVAAGRTADGAEYDEVATLAVQAARNLQQARIVGRQAAASAAQAQEMSAQVRALLAEGLLDGSVKLKHLAADTRGALDGKAAKSHNHSVGQVTGLQSALDSKAPKSHGHNITEIDGLQAALDVKAAGTHTHRITDLQKVGASGNLTTRGEVNGIDYNPAPATIPVRLGAGELTCETGTHPKHAVNNEALAATLRPGGADTTVNAYAAGKARTIVARIHDGQIAVQAPTENYHAANKSYVDGLLSARPTVVDLMTGVRIWHKNGMCMLRISHSNRAELEKRLPDLRVPENLRPQWMSIGAVLNGGNITVSGDGVIKLGGQMHSDSRIYAMTTWLVW